MSIADDLRKAYDERKQIRNAYEQGYADGKRDAVVHGHWIKADLDPHYINHNYVTCSNCKELNRDDRLAFIPDYAKGMHYCMICGAKTDDSTQSNDSNTLDALGEKVKK